METKLLKEFAANTLVGAMVFGWIFTQPPLPEQLRAPKAARHTIIKSEPEPSKTQIQQVQQTTPADVQIKIEPTTLQAPAQGLKPLQNVVEVTATSLKMRTAPSSSAQMIDVYSRGATFEKIGQDGKWLQVRSTIDGTAGWMFGDYLQTTN